MNQKFELARERAEQYVKRARTASRNPGFLLAVTDRERTLHTQAFGMHNLEAEIPLEADALLQIGSISKTFAAVTSLRLMEQGVLDLHKPLVETLPWFKVKSPFCDSLTPHHLLSHSTGLPYSSDFAMEPWSVVYGLRDIELGFEPGTEKYYSEPGFQTLTVLLETLTGRPYGELVTELVFEPLDMHNSHAPITRTLRPLMPSGYKTLYDDRPALPCHPLVPSPWMEFNSSDGAVASTVADMSKFMRMLLNRGVGPHGRLLTEETFTLMTTPQVPDSSYGYGIFSFENEGHRYLLHGGEMPSYESMIQLDMDLGIGEVQLGTQPYPQEIYSETFVCWRSAFDAETALPEEPEAADPLVVENAVDFAGEYTTLDGSASLRIEAVGEGMHLVCDDGTVPLFHREDDVFSANLPGWDRFVLDFERTGEDGPVTHFWHGDTLWLNENYDGPRSFEVPEAWHSYEGHYRSWVVWEPVFRIVIRGDKLFQILPWGGVEQLNPLEDGSFRVGDADWETSPERMRFAQVVDGKALKLVYSGVDYYRWFVE